MVIGKMIGVPDEHVDAFRSWTDSFLEIQGPQDYLDSLGNFYELFAELLAERRRAPRDDLMTALLAAEVDGQRLRDEELLGFCFLLVLAGNDTTSSLIGTGAVLLATIRSNAPRSCATRRRGRTRSRRSTASSHPRRSCPARRRVTSSSTAP